MLGIIPVPIILPAFPVMPFLLVVVVVNAVAPAMLKLALGLVRPVKPVVREKIVGILPVINIFLNVQTVAKDVIFTQVMLLPSREEKTVQVRESLNG